MTTKRELTKLFLEQSGLALTIDESVIKTYLKAWWITPHSPIGFRLSCEGNRFMKDVLKLQHYTFKIKEDNTKSLKLFLQMNKYIVSPYYLQGQNTVIFYGEQDGIMMALYAGDLQQYLENFTR